MSKPKGNKTQYISKGQVPTINRKLRNAMRRDRQAERLIRQQEAFRKGKRTMVTIENPNKEETNKRFIKVPGEQFFKQYEVERRHTREETYDV